MVRVHVWPEGPGRWDVVICDSGVGRVTVGVGTTKASANEYAKRLRAVLRDGFTRRANTTTEGR